MVSVEKRHVKFDTQRECPAPVRRGACPSARPDELVLALVTLNEGGVDRSREGRIVELEREVLGACLTGGPAPAGAEYLSLKLDDPSFPSPIYATLTQGDSGEHKLIWSR